MLEQFQIPIEKSLKNKGGEIVIPNTHFPNLLQALQYIMAGLN
jgi:hypothetical protein